MLLQNLIYILQQDKEGLLLEGDLLSSALETYPTEYVVIPVVVKEGINSYSYVPVYVPVYVSENHFIIEIDSENNYLKYKLQDEALQAIKKSLKISYLVIENLDFYTSSQGDKLTTYSITKQVSVNSIHKDWDIYSSKINKSIEDLLHQSKIVSSSNIKPSLYKRIKNFFKC